MQAEERRPQPVFWAVLALVTLLGVANALSFWTINIDDSYISLRYARNLLSGEGLVYNPGERVEGFSNPPWVALLAATLLLGADSLEGSKLVGVLCHAFTIVAAAGLALELTRTERAAARVSAALGAGILAVSLPACYWPVTGMETTAYAALIIGTYWRLAVELRTPAARPWSAPLAAVAALSRPEAPLVVGGAWLARLLAGRHDLRRLGVWMGIFLTPTLGYLLFRLVYYGYPLANTYYQKGNAGTLEILADYLRPWVTLEAPFLVLGLVGLGVLARHSRASWPMLLGVAGHGVFLVVISRDWMANQRFIVPILPLLATGLAAGAALLAERLSPRLAWGVPLAVAVLLGGQLWRTAPVQRADMEGEAVTFEPRDPWMVLPDALTHSWKGHAAVPIWLMEHAEPGATVAYTDIGMTGWITDYVILDLAGLVDASISGATGLETWEQRAAYIGERRPDWIILKTAGRERFESISGQPWLVEAYELMEGPRDTLAARRLDAAYASDEEILAAYVQAIAREPASGRFLWRYALWAAAVGTPAQLTDACDQIQRWPDLTDAQEGCVRLLAGDRKARRPDTTVAPLPAALTRFLAGAPRQVTAAVVAPAAAVDAVLADQAPPPPLDAPRPPAPTAHTSPLADPGQRGLGRGWVAYPATKAETYAALVDGALYIQQHSEAFSLCGPLEGTHGTQLAQVSGLWRAEAAGARAYLVAQDGAGKRLRDRDGRKDFVLVESQGPRGWGAFSAAQHLPEGTARVRLCLDFQGPEGTARAAFAELQVLAEADAN